MRQKAVIIDIDGTLSNSQHTNLFPKPNGGVDWAKWMASNKYALVHEWCKELCIAMYKSGYKIIFMTARSSNFDGHTITRDWLNSHLNAEGLYDYELIMRPNNDFRPDTDVKLMLYTTLVVPHYDILFAVDDKSNIVNLWRNLGITALHCTDY